MTETETIGFALLREDKTLVLDLRAEAEDGTVGHTRLEYPPSHPNYAEVLAHLSPIVPGERRPVPPWD